MSDMQEDNRSEVQGETLPEPGTAIATITEWDSRGQSMRSSISADDPAGIATLIAAISSKDADLQSSYGTEIIVKDYVLHVREAVDEATGEVSPRLRLVLITADGKRIAGGSKGVIDGWSYIAKCLWPKLNGNMIGVTLARFPAKKQGYYYVIDKIRLVPTTTAKPRK